MICIWLLFVLLFVLLCWGVCLLCHHDAIVRRCVLCAGDNTAYTRRPPHRDAIMYDIGAALLLCAALCVVCVPPLLPFSPPPPPLFCAVSWRRAVLLLLLRRPCVVCCALLLCCAVGCCCCCCWAVPCVRVRAVCVCCVFALWVPLLCVCCALSLCTTTTTHRCAGAAQRDNIHICSVPPHTHTVDDNTSCTCAAAADDDDDARGVRCAVLCVSCCSLWDRNNRGKGGAAPTTPVYCISSLCVPRMVRYSLLMMLCRLLSSGWCSSAGKKPKRPSAVWWCVPAAGVLSSVVAQHRCAVL